MLNKEIYKFIILIDERSSKPVSISVRVSEHFAPTKDSYQSSQLIPRNGSFHNNGGNSFSSATYIYISHPKQPLMSISDVLSKCITHYINSFGDIMDNSTEKFSYAQKLAIKHFEKNHDKKLCKEVIEQKRTQQ